MADPGQVSSQFLAGQQLTAGELDVNNDLIPYFKRMPDGEYLSCVVSPADLYAAMSA